MKLAGRRCLIVGAGPVAEEKIEGLLPTGARLRVIAPHATARVKEWARAKKITWHARAYRPSDLTGAFLVVAATSSPSLHAQIYKQALRRAVLCNVVDDPPHCDFYYGSVVRRGSLQIAISTAGHSPALAQRLRKQLEREIGPEYELWLQALGAARKKLFKKRIATAERRALLHQLASEEAFREFQQRYKRKVTI
jgi:precorrin-2 dehydrogenase / sirohydrochlorin ferrochelatase